MTFPLTSPRNNGTLCEQRERWVIFLYFSDGKLIFFLCMCVFVLQRGPVGPRGPAGPPGAAGVPGVDGIDVSRRLASAQSDGVQPSDVGQSCGAFSFLG